MMKLSFFLNVGLMLTGLTTNAQFAFEFGTLEQNDIEIKTCAFDPESDAVILIHEANSDYDAQYNLVTMHHIRMKVLREKGIEYADIEIPYQSKNEYQYISHVVAKTFNPRPDGGIDQFVVDPKSIYRKKVNEYFSVLRFAFPQVKVGSIIEYSYQSVYQSYGALKEWTFQENLPVCRSSYTVRMAPNLQFNYSVQKNDSFKIDIRQNKSDALLFFEMKNIPALDEEPFMDAREDYLQKVNFQFSNYVAQTGLIKYIEEWKDVSRKLNHEESFGKQTRVNISELNELIKSTITTDDSVVRLRKLYDLIRNKVEWNGITSRGAAEGVKTVWAKKTGTSGSINLLLVNALKSAGFEAYPMLVSERGNGSINTSKPYLDQFNSIYAAVTLGGREYYLDARDRFTPAYLIPAKILNTAGFIVNGKDGRLVKIEENKYKCKTKIYIEATLREDGQLSGKVYQTLSDYARNNTVHEYNGHKESYLKEKFQDKIANAQISELTFENLDNDTLSLSQNFNFVSALQQSDNYSFLNLNMLNSYPENPYLKTRRFSNINYGYAQTTTVTLFVNLPSNIVVDAIPKNVRMKNSSESIYFSRMLALSDDKKRLTVELKMDISKSWFEAYEYEDLREFYRKMTDFINEQVVLKKLTGS